MSEVGHVRGGRADRSGKEEKQRRPGTNLILLPIGIAYYYKVYLDRGIGLIHLPLRDNNRTVVYDQHLKVQGRIRLMVPRTRLCQQFPCISVPLFLGSALVSFWGQNPRLRRLQIWGPRVGSSSSTYGRNHGGGSRDQQVQAFDRLTGSARHFQLGWFTPGF